MNIRRILIPGVIILTLVLNACSKDEDQWTDHSLIVAKVINGDFYNNKIDSISATIYYQTIDTNNYLIDKADVISKSKFENGGCRLLMPDLPDRMLNYRINEIFPSIIINDTTARINFIRVRGIRYGHSIGDLIYQSSSNPRDSIYTRCEYVYCNKTVQIRGKIITNSNYYRYSVYYDISFRKGWNQYFTKTIRSDTDTRIYHSSSLQPNDLLWYPMIMIEVEPPSDN